MLEFGLPKEKFLEFRILKCGKFLAELRELGFESFDTADRSSASRERGIDE
jgi:hypothetical protein